MVTDFMLVLLVLICLVLVNASINGGRLGYANNFESVKRKGTVKTIEVSASGDIIDCVEIYKQPAFDHPLLKNHTIEKTPSSSLSEIKSRSSQAKLIQDWFKNGECPEGTIPIIRPQRTPIKLHTKFGDVTNAIHEYAQVYLPSGTYYGAHADLNVWKPITYDRDISLGQTWVESGEGEELNTIEAGWITHSGENHTRFFIYWTRDNYRNTGCYNLDCPGFVQTSRVYIPGSILGVSSYNGSQLSLLFTIAKVGGNWWLQVEGQYVGYWPCSIFTRLYDHATTISWGGEVATVTRHARHTQTQMGSGHFSHEGLRRASFFTQLQYKDQIGSFKHATNLIPVITNRGCYDLTLDGSSPSTFFYGGPGYSETCH